jgi:hypothetical protein
MPLVYTTSSRAFADRAIETLIERGISSYLSGGSGDVPGSSAAYGVHIEKDVDWGRANEVLIELGAAKEEPLPSGPRVRWILFAIGIGLGLILMVVFQ